MYLGEFSQPLIESIFIFGFHPKSISINTHLNCLDVHANALLKDHTDFLLYYPPPMDNSIMHWCSLIIQAEVEFQISDFHPPIFPIQKMVGKDKNGDYFYVHWTSFYSKDNPIQLSQQYSCISPQNQNENILELETNPNSSVFIPSIICLKTRIGYSDVIDFYLRSICSTLEDQSLTGEVRNFTFFCMIKNGMSILTPSPNIELLLISPSHTFSLREFGFNCLPNFNDCTLYELGKRLKANDLILLWTAILLEEYVVLSVEDTDCFYYFQNGIKQLVYPFEIMLMYNFQSAPPNLNELLDSPVRFCISFCRKYFPYHQLKNQIIEAMRDMQGEALLFLFQINIQKKDNDLKIYQKERNPLKYPRADLIYRKLDKIIKRIKPNISNEKKVEFSQSIRKIFFEEMIWILNGIEAFRNQYNSLDEKALLASKKEQDREFWSALIQTTGFLEFFHDCISEQSKRFEVIKANYNKKPIKNPPMLQFHIGLKPNKGIKIFKQIAYFYENSQPPPSKYDLIQRKNWTKGHLDFQLELKMANSFEDIQNRFSFLYGEDGLIEFMENINFYESQTKTISFWNVFKKKIDDFSNPNIIQDINKKNPVPQIAAIIQSVLYYKCFEPNFSKEKVIELYQKYNTDDLAIFSPPRRNTFALKYSSTFFQNKLPNTQILQLEEEKKEEQIPEILKRTSEYESILIPSRNKESLTGCCICHHHFVMDYLIWNVHCADKHCYCYDCFRKWILLQYHNNKKIGEVKCKICEAEILYQTFSVFVSEEILKEWESRTYLNSLGENFKLVECPQCHLQYEIKVGNGTLEDFFQCPKCKLFICSGCQKTLSTCKCS